ncbi:hypothetical protein [Sphaerisporangium corydalis]|uniref:Uncharacterized protein n=1 Tax=Sphaerisporangium corydalis TaxID=1441875 RepID=A0ABV9EBV1_9ACTN|nr:hypothetical protein [Sphaerisporangium corydalis]
MDLSVPQIAGSALAAVTAAVAASFLGVTGTVVGAAVASAATTVGNAVYTHYIKRTHVRLKEAHGLILGEQEQRALDEEAQEAVVARPGEDGLATAAHATVRDHGPPDLPPPTGDTAPQDLGTAETPLLSRVAVAPLWVRLVVAAVVTFALSMGGILAFELFSGRPLAATVHGQGGSGTSWGGQVEEKTESPAPTPSSSEGKASPGASTKASPGTSEEPQAPAETGQPPAPSSEPSTESTGDTTVPPSGDPGTQGDATGQPSTTSR